MIPKINNKSFLEISEEDLSSLIDNEAYRENEYIDYKQNFAFLEMQKGNERYEKICEFRSDVCSFANANSGYLIFGISDNHGCASEIIGIDIPDDNTDKFELDRRNNLSSIMPKTPYIKFHFIKLENGKYVVVVFVKHDSLSPYIHLENEKNYKIYKRDGNGKRVVGYQEMKNMFNQSLSLEKEIYNYRIDRINYYRNQEDNEEKWYSQFLLFHIIPETFSDSSYNQNMLILEKIKGKQFRYIFSNFSCGTFSAPCVDGLRFISGDSFDKGNMCYLNNNGIAECFMPLLSALNIGYGKNPNGFIAWEYIWNKIRDTYWLYLDTMKDVLLDQKLYICISVLGCKGVTSENAEFDFRSKTIDRDTVICAPVATDNISNEEEKQLLLKKLYVEFLISIGVKNDASLNKLIEEVYHA